MLTQYIGALPGPRVRYFGTWSGILSTISACHEEQYFKLRDGALMGGFQASSSGDVIFELRV